MNSERGTVGSPYLNSGESIILTIDRVSVNAVPSDVILTTERLILVDSRYERFEPHIIPLNTILTVKGGKTPSQEPVIILTLGTPSGSHASESLQLLFLQQQGEDRFWESNEWVKKIIEQVVVARQHVSSPENPPKNNSGIRPLVRRWVAPDMIQPHTTQEYHRLNVTSNEPVEISEEISLQDIPEKETTCVQNDHGSPEKNKLPSQDLFVEPDEDADLPVFHEQNVIAASDGVQEPDQDVTPQETLPESSNQIIRTTYDDQEDQAPFPSPHEYEPELNDTSPEIPKAIQSELKARESLTEPIETFSEPDGVLNLYEDDSLHPVENSLQVPKEYSDIPESDETNPLQKSDIPANAEPDEKSASDDEDFNSQSDKPCDISAPESQETGEDMDDRQFREPEVSMTQSVLDQETESPVQQDQYPQEPEIAGIPVLPDESLEMEKRIETDLQTYQDANEGSLVSGETDTPKDSPALEPVIDAKPELSAESLVVNNPEESVSDAPQEIVYVPQKSEDANILVGLPAPELRTSSGFTAVLDQLSHPSGWPVPEVPAPLHEDSIISPDTEPRSTENSPEAITGSPRILDDTMQDKKTEFTTPPDVEPKADMPIPAAISPGPREPVKQNIQRPDRKKIIVSVSILLILLAVLAIVAMMPGLFLERTHTPPLFINISATVSPAVTNESESIPKTGTWVRIIYNGTYIGSVGNPGEMQPVSGTGDQIYAPLKNYELIQASIQKQDYSGETLTVKVYTHGRLIAERSTRVPHGTVDILLDTRTENPPGITPTIP